MEKVLPWCGQPSDRGGQRTEQNRLCLSVTVNIYLTGKKRVVSQLHLKGAQRT